MPIDGAMTDGPSDGHLGSNSDGHVGSDASAACVTIPSIGVSLCPSGSPGGAIDLTSSTTLATDTGSTSPPNAMLSCAPMTAASTPDVCAIFATSIKIESGITLAATGPRPFVLIATNAIDIEGVLDVASHIGGATGPGPVPSACGHDSTTPQGETGAEGGSYGAKGASGGGDENDDTVGSPGDVIGLVALTAGCPGAVGGNGGGHGGPGGGVVLVDTPMLTIGSSGQIDASGAAASGASSGQRGGGGGGAGGLIVLDAPTFTLTSSGQIYANGGHGGGGSTSTQAGSDGTDPSGWNSGGGNGGANGGAGTGSVGSHQTTAAGNGGTGDNGDGGGGGGGGFGIIKIITGSTVLATNISPTPS